MTGIDVNSGMARYTFGRAALSDGVGFTVVAVDLFAVSELVKNPKASDQDEGFINKIKNIMPTFRQRRPAAAVGATTDRASSLP